MFKLCPSLRQTPRRRKSAFRAVNIEDRLARGYWLREPAGRSARHFVCPVRIFGGCYISEVMNDHELLKRYAASRCEAAFTELVKR